MDTVSLTYDEIAERLGISGASARNLVRRKRWSRSVGNDGRARITVPVDVIEGAANAPADPPAEVPTHGAASGAAEGAVEGASGVPSEVAMQLARLEVEVAGLRDLVAAEKRRAEAAETDRDRWHALAVRPWWKRLAG